VNTNGEGSAEGGTELGLPTLDCEGHTPTWENGFWSGTSTGCRALPYFRSSAWVGIRSNLAQAKLARLWVKAKVASSNTFRFFIVYMYANTRHAAATYRSAMLLRLGRHGGRLP